MNLNYDIKKWDFKLRATTLTAITKNIVEAARLHPTSTIDAKRIAKRATKNAEKLDLLPGMITEIKIMIKPMIKGILRWYELYGFGICPILTPVGTVDGDKSAKALVECKDQPISTLFNLSCDHCLEEYIFRFWSQLSREDRVNYEESEKRLHLFQPGLYNNYLTSVLQFFWLRQIYDSNYTQFIGKITLDSLSETNCAEGLNYAILIKNSSAIEYFWKKASRCEVFSNEYYHPLIQDAVNWMPPALLAKLLQFDQANYLKGTYPNLMLRALLQWPYQHLFLKAAERFLPRFDVWEYLDVLKAIITIAQCDYEDYNYKGLLIDFWRMGKDHKSHLNSGQKEIYNLLSQAFRMNDKNIAFTVFDDMLESNREEFFNNFVRNHFENLIYYRKYKVLLLLLHVCKVRDQRLYFKFKSFFVTNSTYMNCDELPVSSRPYQTWLRLREFVKVMTKWEKSGCPDGQSTVC